MRRYWHRYRGEQHDLSGDKDVNASFTITRGGRADPDASKGEGIASQPAISTTKTAALQFGRDQIRSLVRRVFLQGWPRPARQVVFSAATRGLEISSICREVGEVLADEKVGRVSLVDACLTTRALEQSFGETSDHPQAGVRELRKSSRQLAPYLWLVTAETFLGSTHNEHNAAWLCGRLGELRREFDFAVIHAAPSHGDSGSAFLGHFADGIVLALEAHRTRRITAMKIREQLVTANVRLLGVVLCDRNFPIPEKLYQKL